MTGPRAEPITVLGGGSWGTTLAQHLAQTGYHVLLWLRDTNLAQEIAPRRENVRYLPGIRLDARIQVTTDLERVAGGEGPIISALPSHAVREVLRALADLLRGPRDVLSATKGIEVETGLRMSQILAETLPSGSRIAALSGPSFAREVAREAPTVVVVASQDQALATDFQVRLSTPAFRVYTNNDLIGTELGGALKNIMAIAAGTSDGLGLGYNARAALITRGLAEISRIGRALGADPLTFAGLSGLGDLVLTCTGDLSRNRTVGLRLGRGERLQNILDSLGMVAEGVKTTAAAHRLARKIEVEMPITAEVFAILYEGKAPRDALMDLMTRAMKHELA